MSEIELMRMVAAGDRVAIQTLIDTHYDPIFRLLRHLTGRREDAED
jgi:DNA-directed RNA polymerase specialized sigma24 family protein